MRLRNSKFVKEADNQIFFIVFIALLWSKDILLGYLRGFLMKIPLLSAMADFLIPCLLFLLFLLSIRGITKRLRGSDFIFVVVCLVVYIGEFFLFKRNRDYYRIEYMDFLLGCLPFYFVGVALRGDWEERIILWLYRISCVTIIVFDIYMMFFNQLEGVTLRGGDMESAYNVLPHVFLVFYFMMDEFKWHRLAIFLLGTFGILMMGTRGAVICLLLFVVVVAYFKIQFRRPIVLLVLTTICLLFVFFGKLTDLLIDGAYWIADRFQLSTRIFDKMLSGQFAISDARVYLRQRVRFYLRGYSITGLGIYGDRFVANGQYAHNLFLEIYSNFGYLLGTILAVSFVVLIYRGFRYGIKSGNNQVRLIILLLLCFCFKLMVSGSYLREPFFWVMLGYFVSLVREMGQNKDSRHLSMRESKFIKR